MPHIEETCFAQPASGGQFLQLGPQGRLQPLFYRHAYAFLEQIDANLGIRQRGLEGAMSVYVNLPYSPSKVFLNSRSV